MINVAASRGVISGSDVLWRLQIGNFYFVFPPDPSSSNTGSFDGEKSGKGIFNSKKGACGVYIGFYITAFADVSKCL